jgi:hypothetical protein
MVGLQHKIFDFEEAAEEKSREGTAKNVGGAVRALGILGEQLVHYMEGGQRSTDRFNQGYDIIDRMGRKIEVKTQYRFRRYHRETDSDRDIFSVGWAPEGEIHHTNLQKCLNVDRLIFVEYRPIIDIPPSRYPYDEDFHDYIFVWECTDRLTNTGRYKAGKFWKFSWPIDLMIKTWEMHDPEAASKFREYSIAGNSLD